MKYYDIAQTQNFYNEKFAFVLTEVKENVLYITLNRASQKNALHPQMVNEIAFCMQYAHDTSSIWLVVIKANGNVFCSGADLKAMMGIIEENDSTIPSPAEEILLGELFQKAHIPIITQVSGDVYAGGFFFLSESTIVVAQENIKLGLPEVKRGLFPFQVMASLLKIMPPRKVIDWCVRGYNLPVEEAEKYGLVTCAVPENEIEEKVNSIIQELKENSPSAIKFGMEAFQNIHSGESKHSYLLSMLQKTIMTKDGQEGIAAFREKRKPNWKGE